MSLPVGASCTDEKKGKTTSVSPAAFLKWAKQRDIFVHPDVDAFHSTPEMGGVGVFARKSLPAGTVVLSTPCTAAISPYSEPHPRLPSITVLQTCSGEDGSALPLARRDPVLVVILRLMAECCRGKSSLFHPWLQHCPNMCVHLFDLSVVEKQVLGITTGDSEEGEGSTNLQYARWTGVSQQLRELRIEERWSLAQQEVISVHPDIWPPQKATFALFCRCVAHVFSRNFHREEMVGREGPYLLPGLDFLNHSEPPNTKFEVRGGGRKHGTTFTVVTSDTVKAGEQVFATYGSIGSSRFAVEFQFLSSDIVLKDLCRFSCEQLIDMAVHLLVSETESNAVDSGQKSPNYKMDFSNLYKEVSRRVEILQRLGLLYDEGLYLKGNGYYPSSSLDAIQDSDSEADITLLPIPFDNPASADQLKRLRRWSAEEQSKEWNRFRNVVFLLLLPTRENFEDYYHRDVSAHWVAPKTSATTKAVRDFLQLKLCAVRRTWWAVTRTFITESAVLPEENSVKSSELRESALVSQRVDLLRCALGSEQGVLMEHIGMLSE